MKSYWNLIKDTLTYYKDFLLPKACSWSPNNIKKITVMRKCNFLLEANKTIFWQINYVYLLNAFIWTLVKWLAAFYGVISDKLILNSLLNLPMHIDFYLFICFSQYVGKFKRTPPINFFCLCSIISFWHKKFELSIWIIHIIFSFKCFSDQLLQMSVWVQRTALSAHPITKVFKA